MNSVLKLKPYLKPFVWLIVGSTLLAFPLAALRFGPVPLVKYLVDDILVSKDVTKLYLFPIFIVGIYVLNFIVRFFHYYFLRVVIARINQQVKVDLFNHLLGLSADYFTEQSTGTLMSRVGNDPQVLDSGVASINVIIREPITFLILFGYTLYLNWQLTLITVFMFPVLAFVFVFTGKALRRYMGHMQEENAKIYSTLQETFTGIRVITAFRLESYVKKRFQVHTDKFRKILLKSAALEEAAHPMVELVTSFAVAPVIYYGGKQVLAGTMTPGDLLSFFTAFALMLNPIRLLNEVNLKLSQAASATDRVYTVLNWKSNLRESVNPIPIHEFREEIKFENVGFSYPDAPERPILKGIQFSVPQGKVIAVVGESGAGKSSLLSLLPRIFDVTQGKITIDGMDLRDLNVDDLRRLISIVTQDVFLFNDTIEENIRCGKLGASFEEVQEAAKLANAHEFIETLPQGYQTIIGDRGQKLSGGERQRVSIARAFLRKSPILLLDEATSNLDTASERAVQAALEQLMKKRTTIVIAHRLSTIRNADQIIVLKDGLVKEAGSHQELLQLDGEYCRFQKLSAHTLTS